MNPAFFEQPAIQATAANLASEVMDELARYRDIAVRIDSETLAAIELAVQQLAEELLSDHMEQARRPAPGAEPINAEAIHHLAAFQAAVLRSCGEPFHPSEQPPLELLSTEDQLLSAQDIASLQQRGYDVVYPSASRCSQPAPAQAAASTGQQGRAL